MFGPCLEVGRGKVFEVMCTLPEFALVMATIIQIEYVVAPLVIECLDITYPVVVSGRGPILNRRKIGLFRRLLFGRDCREIECRFVHVIGIQLPRILLRPSGVTEREIVIEQFAVHVHRPART